MVTVFVGAYAYARRVLEAFTEPPSLIVTAPPGAPRWEDVRDIWPDVPISYGDLVVGDPDLVVVAGWRRLVPILGPTVGFHSAKLPEYPGRAPVPNALLRGDAYTTNTMLWLNGEPDAGDIIDEWEFPCAGRTPDDIYGEMGETAALMLRRHWHGLLDGTTPRRKQDLSRRGPLTSAEAWAHV